MDADGVGRGSESGGDWRRNKILFPYQTVLPSAWRDSTYNGADFPAYFMSLQRLRPLRCFLYCHMKSANEKDGWRKRKGKCEGKEEAFPPLLYNELSIKFRGTANISRSSHVWWKYCIDLRVDYKVVPNVCFVCMCISRRFREITGNRLGRNNDRKMILSLKSDSMMIDDNSCALKCLFDKFFNGLTQLVD